MPAVSARLAERAWFTVPRHRGRGGQAPVGHRFELELYGATMVGEYWGDGPPVYLVHGWGGRRDDLGALVTQLVQAGYRVVAFDAPSHGESAAGAMGRRQGNVWEMTAALEAAVAAQGPPYAVVAHSLGSMAVAMALRNGMTAKRLVLLAPMANAEQYTYEFARRVGFGERTRTRLVTRIERRVGTPMRLFDVPSVADQVPVPPLLLVHDVDDIETSYADSEAIAARWPDATLVRTTGLGHRRVTRSPDVVAQVVAFIG